MATQQLLITDTGRPVAAPAPTPSVEGRLERLATRLGLRLPHARRALTLRHGSVWEDWPDRKIQAELKELCVRRLVMQGELPEHFRGEALCAQCGPIPVPVGTPYHLTQCPYCAISALTDRVVHRPRPTSCGDCKHAEDVSEGGRKVRCVIGLALTVSGTRDRELKWTCFGWRPVSLRLRKD